jgi:hypothetical protein
MVSLKRAELIEFYPNGGIKFKMVLAFIFLTFGSNE